VRRFTVHMTEGGRPAGGGRWHAAEEAVGSEGSDFFFFSTVFAPLRRLRTLVFSKFASFTVDGRKLWAETVLALILGRDIIITRKVPVRCYG
jgi:hypothetical protein